MKARDANKLTLGLYKVTWKDSKGGGHSYAAVGMQHDGSRWLAPINWVAPTMKQDIWKSIESMTLLAC